MSVVTTEQEDEGAPAPESKKGYKRWENCKTMEGGTTADIIRSVKKLNDDVEKQRKKLSRFFA